jgi:DedD protein
MESKLKYRILGVLVVVAMIVIVMPFVHLRKDNKTEGFVNPPAFPDQTAQVSQPAPIVNNGTEFSQNEVQPSTVPDEAIITPKSVNDAPVINNATAAPIANAQSTPPAIAEIPVSQQAIEQLQQPPKKSVKQHIAKAKTKHQHLAQQKPRRNTYPTTQMTIHDNGLYDVQKPVWVIQLGSYQSKETAIRMVDSLRANGYKAFFQEMDTVLGQKISVFVGPEIQQVAARQVAKQLQAELKVRGTVVSYKPFSL